MLPYNLKKPAPVFDIFQSSSKQGFGETLNRRQGRFEFVRNICDEIPARPFQPSNFGDVMQHHDGAYGLIAGADRGRVYGKIARSDRSHNNLVMESFSAR